MLRGSKACRDALVYPAPLTAVMGLSAPVPGLAEAVLPLWNCTWTCFDALEKNLMMFIGIFVFVMIGLFCSWIAKNDEEEIVF